MLRQSLTIIAFALFCVFLQATIFGTFLPRWMIPNLCLVIVIFLAVFEVNAMGALLAFLVGILFDLSSGQLLGPWSGALVCVYGIISQGGRKLFLDSWITIAGVTFVASIIAQAVYLFLLSQFKFSFGDLISATMHGSAFITALLAPPFFMLLRGSVHKKNSNGSRYVQQRLF